MNARLKWKAKLGFKKHKRPRLADPLPHVALVLPPSLGASCACECALWQAAGPRPSLLTVRLALPRSERTC